MHVLPLLIVVLLAAAITGIVYALASRAGGRKRPGLLIGSIVVGVLALAGIALMIPALIDDVHVEVIMITTGPG